MICDDDLCRETLDYEKRQRRYAFKQVANMQKKLDVKEAKIKKLKAALKSAKTKGGEQLGGGVSKKILAISRQLKQIVERKTGEKLVCSSARHVSMDFY